MKTYIIHDYESDYKFEVETDWTNPEIADQFLDEDIEEMDKLKVGERYEIADLGIILGTVTRVR
ncbi:hypothetical protein DSECCO2_649970 [anaerobic digester metagenome]